MRLLAIGAVALSISTMGQTRKEYSVYGSGMSSCGAYIRSDAEEQRLFESWLLGFASGAGAIISASGREMVKSDPSGLLAWVSKYCSDHPLDSIAEAGEEMIATLVVKKQIAP